MHWLLFCSIKMNSLKTIPVNTNTFLQSKTSYVSVAAIQLQLLKVKRNPMICTSPSLLEAEEAEEAELIVVGIATVFAGCG